jgi:signal transduction histidine kinase
LIAPFLAGAALGGLAAAAAAYCLARRRRERLGRFLGFAAHEISAPVTAASMTVHNFSEGFFGPLTPEQRPWIDMLREQTSRLSVLITDLRDAIHMELRQDLRFESESVPLAPAVDYAARAVAHGCAQAGIPLELSVPPAIGDVQADGERLSRILTGLLAHAKKFHTSGPISVSAARDGGRVALSIAYEGSAIGEAEADRSLELYYPGSGVSQMLTATGLGLGLARELLRLQGADLTLSVTGKRHVLTVQLAAAPASAAAAPGAP